MAEKGDMDIAAPGTTVVICEIEPVCIEGLRALLESSGLRVIGTETSLLGGIDAVRELKPNLLIADKSFGLQPVMDWIMGLRREQPSLSVVVWSSAVADSDVLHLLQAGAQGVVRKSAPLTELISCIQAVAGGRTWMENDSTGAEARPVRAARAPLTMREMQVMEWVERGMKNKEIAVRLGIQTGTVKIHMKHIFEKTGIRGRYGLALSGLKEKGLLASRGSRNVVRRDPAQPVRGFAPSPRPARSAAPGAPEPVKLFAPRKFAPQKAARPVEAVRSEQRW